MKVIINRCYGGLSVSEEAIELYQQRTGKTEIDAYTLDWERDDPVWIEIVEELGDRADGRAAKIDIVEVPEGYGYWIEDYDGMEFVRLVINEEYLRNLIRSGNEDDIVAYVMRAN